MRARSSEKKSVCTRHGGASSTRNVESNTGRFTGSKAAPGRLSRFCTRIRMIKAGIVGGTGYTGAELLREAVYGLCELNRERIRRARLVANPGCYPTAIQLGFLPLVEAGAVDLDHLIADAKSGVSGAGRKAELSLTFSEASDNFMAYNVPGHRHRPEIRESLAQAAKREVGLVFTSHLTPIIRGIHATLYGRITHELDFQQLFEK